MAMHFWAQVGGNAMMLPKNWTSPYMMVSKVPFGCLV